MIIFCYASHLYCSYSKILADRFIHCHHRFVVAELLRSQVLSCGGDSTEMALCMSLLFFRILSLYQQRSNWAIQNAYLHRQHMSEKIGQALNRLCMSRLQEHHFGICHPMLSYLRNLSSYRWSRCNSDRSSR